jgi:hypothetical protein
MSALASTKHLVNTDGKANYSRQKQTVLPVREILALTPKMQHSNWHSAGEKEGNSSVNSDAEKSLFISSRQKREFAVEAQIFHLKFPRI